MTPCELCDKDAVAMCEGFLVCEDCCWPKVDDNDPCELCDKEAVVMCEGFLVCEDCCYLYASKLAQMHDDIQDELRGS